MVAISWAITMLTPFAGAQTSAYPSNVGPDVPKFWVRPGFRVTLVADKLENARFMEFGANGTLYLSRPDNGDILTLRAKGDRYEVVNTFAKPGQSVHGMHYVDGWLWFTKSDSIYKGRDTDGDGKADEIVTVVTGLPHGGHWWRPIYVVSDGFFTSIGDSGNATDQPETDRQKIWKYSLDGKTRVLWSSGLRNTEKYRYRPGTTELYGCDQGSDWYGRSLGDREGRQPITDMEPPEEMNLYVQGGFYGHPYLFGNRVPRIEYQNRPDIIDLAEKTIVPEWTFGPHWAADGWNWLNTDHMGAGWKGDAVVAFHGSWNSSVKKGYQVEHVFFDKVTGKPYGNNKLVGLLSESGQVLARAVDIVEEPSGDILFSDDLGQRIFRISPVKS
jgi:glucose/arabinose dehydrogenase